MASLGLQKSYLPKCKYCGVSISFLEWRTDELCEVCLKKNKRVK
ncbi:MAG: hypothetical protein ACTSO9_16480 [Candidatus Helarchaeota archaeon]